MYAVLYVLARLALGVMWIIAGTAKLRTGARRGELVADFGVPPARAARWLGVALPWIEIVLGGLLLAGLWPRMAGGASAALLLAFTVVIALNLLRGRRPECRCFGETGRGPVSWLSVARNAFLLAVALATAAAHPEYLTLAGWLRGAAIGPSDPSPVELVPALLLAASGSLICALAVGAWQVAQAIARAEGGPALGMPERHYLRKRMGLLEEGSPPAAETR